MHTLDSFFQRGTMEDEEVGPSERPTTEPEENASSRKRATRSPIVEQFEYLSERTWVCIICKEKYPNTKQGQVQRPPDGSTYPFWNHYKRVHPRIHDSLKGIEDVNRQSYLAGGAEGRMEVQKPKRREFKGFTTEETNNVITRFVCATDSPWSIVDHETFRDMWRYATQRNIDPPTAKVA